MTAIQPPLFIGVNGEIGADELGLPFRDIMGEGILAAGDLAVTQRAAGANMSVDIAAGAAWVKGDDDANAQPTYRIRNDATMNMAIAAADASKPRVDRIVARVYDSAFAGTSLTWTLEVVPGVPTTGATLANLSGAAAVPNTALLLANVLVPAAAGSIVTADIGDKRTSVLIGGGAAGIAAAGAFTVLADVTLGVAASTIDSGVFGTSGYNHLRILTNLRDTAAGNALGTLMQFNGDASASYYWEEIYGQASAVAGGGLSAGATSARAGTHPGAGAAATFRGIHIVDVPFASSAINHCYTSLSHTSGNATSAGSLIDFVAGTYGNGSAISRVRFLANTSFDVGSRIAVLGY